MNINEIKENLKTSQYSFLRDNQNLNSNIVILGLGGSYAYGTNVEDSDIDIRGAAARTKRDILLGNDFEQVIDQKTDTTIYSLEKMFKLLCKGNPNMIEILGLKPEHYFYVSETGKKILDNKNLFLSKRIVKPLNGCIRSYMQEIGKMVRNKTSKKMMNILRLYFMCFDILEKGEIITYRELEQDFLKDVRSGKDYLDSDGTPSDRFYTIVNECKNKLLFLEETSLLPKEPDIKGIESLLMEINEDIIKNG